LPVEDVAGSVVGAGRVVGKVSSVTLEKGTVVDAARAAAGLALPEWFWRRATVTTPATIRRAIRLPTPTQAARGFAGSIPRC